MSALLPPCPYLPSAPEQMDADALSAHGTARDAAFYFTCLTYGQYLWQHRLVARAILKLDRALGADLRGEESILKEWPLPYAAMAWFLRHAPDGVFMGNTRVHFQHLADRMNEPRREQRRWRIWACWAICRMILPDLPDDPKHDVIEPSFDEIAAKLDVHGVPGEAELWLEVLDSVRKEN